MSSFVRKFHFAQTASEGYRLRDRDMMVLYASRFELHNEVRLVSVFYSGYDKICIYPEQYRSFFMQRRSSFFSNTTTFNIYSQNDQLYAEISMYKPGIIRSGVPEFFVIFSASGKLYRFQQVKKRDKVNRLSGNQYDFVGEEGCAGRIQINSPLNTGFVLGHFSERPLVGTIEVTGELQEIPEVLCFLQIMDLFERETNSSI